VSARIADRARMKSYPYAIHELVQKQPQDAVAFINNRGFGTSSLFIRSNTTVGAQSAQ
jgi:hypothetical protein